MAATGLPALLQEPVWFEPLRRPSWLLPPIREGAPRVLFLPGEDVDLDDLRLGLPLFLGEATRFSTDARVEVATGDWAVTAGSAAVVRSRATEDETLVVEVADAAGSVVEELPVAPADDPSLGAGLAIIPVRLAGALRPLGVRAVWSTAFQAPPADLAIAYARSHGVLARLLASAGGGAGHAPTPDLRAGLVHVSHAVSAHASPLGVAAFLAGLAVARDAGSTAWGDFRLQANAIAQRATDPNDPVFRLSIAALTLFGDTGEVASRVHRLAAEPGGDLRTWLVRIGAIG